MQYNLRLALSDDAQISAFWAYRLYAWLLGQIPDETAGQFHEHRAVAQYLDLGMSRR